MFAATHVEVRRWFDEGLVDGLRVDHPDGLRDPEGYLDHLAEPDRRWLHAGREDPRARRGARPAVGDGRHHRVRRPGAARPGAHRPAGQPALTRSRHGCAAAPADWDAAGPRPQARRGRRQPARRDPADRARAARPAATADERLEDAVAEVLACFPVYRSYLPDGPGAPRPGARSGARAHRPDLAARSTSSRPCCATPSHPAALRFQQTQRDGDGQGGRGLRVLPVVAAHLAQRGRRRPEHLRDHAARVARGDGVRASATGRTR